MIERIVVGVDGSPGANAALLWGVQEAARCVEYAAVPVAVVT